MKATEGDMFSWNILDDVNFTADHKIFLRYPMYKWAIFYAW